MTINESDFYRTKRSDLEKGRRMAYLEFDKAVLVLSGAGLALSISLARDPAVGIRSGLLPLLYASWTMYAISMMATLLSFPLGQRAFERELRLLDDYYLSHQRHVAIAKNRYADAVRWLNYLSCAALMTAVALTVLFAAIGVSRL